MRDKLDLKKFWAFHEKAAELARKEFGVDDDGDPYVEVKLVDRTRYHRMHYSPVPYDHDPDLTLEEQEHVERALFLNLKLASDAVDLWSRLRQHQLYEEKKKNDKANAAKGSKLRLCSLPSCAACSYCTDKAETDALGFVHYDIGRMKPPTEAPVYHKGRRTVATFELAGTRVSWVPEPIPEKEGGKTPPPYGVIEASGWKSQFQFEKDVASSLVQEDDRPLRKDGLGLVFQKPQYVSQHLRDWIEAIIHSGSESPVHAVRPGKKPKS